MEEADGVAGTNGREAQGLGQEGLAHTGGSNQQYVFLPAEEFQREDGVQKPAVQGNGGSPVEVLQPAGLLEAGVAHSQFHAPVGAAVDLVGEDDLQERSIVQLVPAGQGNAFGQGGGHGPQLEPLEQRGKFGDAGHG